MLQVKILFAVILGGLFSAISYGQTVIRDFRPVTTDSSVMVEVKLFSEIKQQVQLHAEIKSCADNTIIWKGQLPVRAVNKGDSVVVNHTIDKIEAELWTPTHPTLYYITITTGNSSATKRIGFRKFEMRDGKFFLNNKPIFLRGNSINPPGRGIPLEIEGTKEFARDYIRFLKGMNINLIRIRNNQHWLDVCDEEGMMVFGGRYGRPRGGTDSTPPEDFDSSVNHYKEVELGPLAWHPSIVIFVLSNEQPYRGKAGEAYHQFLDSLYKTLLKWDNTRPYIGNAGYGLGRNADIYDVHRYWGWYYNSFLTFLTLRDKQMWQNEGKTQAITFTECVGNYTGVDGRYNLVSRTKQPYSQLCWTGHIPQEEQAEAALQYQAFVLKNAIEMFRRLRSQNDHLAGVMPFTIPFYHWDNIKTFADMKPKPVAYQYGISYQPILLSWEMWMPNVYAGNAVNVTAHVVNDDDLMQDLDSAYVQWSLEDSNRNPVLSGVSYLSKVKYYDTYAIPLKIELHPDMPTGYYNLKGSIIRNGKEISHNFTEIFIENKNDKAAVRKGSAVTLYDTKGYTRKALDNLNVAYTLTENLDQLDSRHVLIIGELSWDKKLTSSRKELGKFMEKGGRIICLSQDNESFPTEWIPAHVQTISDSNDDPRYLYAGFVYRNGMNINIERPSHPIFEGITRDKLRLWSDYKGFDESQPGMPDIYPVTQGFDLAKNDFDHISVYANYSRGLAATALCEISSGKGSMILSGFCLTPRSGIDPVADRFLCNIIQYACSEEFNKPYSFVDKPIIWGDFSSEKGIVSLAHNGLILNTKPLIPTGQELPVVIDDMGYWYAGVKAAGWNTRPGIQYIPFGRRPFADFSYSVGGNVVAEGDNRQGKGFFLAEVPPGRKYMENSVMNPSDGTIQLSIIVNGNREEYNIPANSTQILSSPLPAENLLRIEFIGDRKAVLLKTEFK